MPRLLALAALAALAAGCTTTAPADTSGPRDAPNRAALVGRWGMEAILDQGADVSDEHNPAGDRYIELYADGTFESGGQPYGRNTGRWTYTPTRRELFIDSNLGPEDDSRWVVTLRGGDVMEWGGTGSAFARRFRIVSRRAD